MSIETFESLSKAGIFTALFAILGWVFVYVNSRALARQAEVNAITAAIEKMLYELADENNKFWRDSKDDEVGRARLFVAYISFRCNFIEEKIKFMNEKCASFWRSDIDHSSFEDKVVDIIAEIRDVSTFNSEQSSKVDDKISKVLEINFLSEQLYEMVYEFLRIRYMSGGGRFTNYFSGA